MKLTKDEAAILARALELAKYEMAVEKGDLPALDIFEDKLREFGKDKRREGRTSLDSWADLMKRFKRKMRLCVIK
jgi:hypothetical protein